jgi:E3 ubiquitin-protein ligase ZNF598
VRRDGLSGGAVAGNAWGSGGSSTAVEDGSQVEEEAAKGKKKGNKGKKQVLMNWG